MAKSEPKKNRYVLHCKRHEKKTRDTRKLAEREVRKRQTTIHAINCKWSVTNVKFAHTNIWRLITTCLDHNHDLSEDSFVFPAHADRNPRRQQAMDAAAALRHSRISFRQAEATLKSLRLSINRNEYYNLQRGRAMTSEDQLRCALYELEEAGFHVRCKESWKYENNIRTKRVVDHFFFANP